MADRLVQLANGRPPQGGLAEHDKLEKQTEEIDEAKLVISRILEEQLGHDFSGYKGKTFIRRVLRRMQITQFDELARYIERLRADPDEVTSLFSDLLIGVTHFFRDSEAFAALEKLVIPRLFQNGGATDYFKAEPATGYETLIYDCLIGDNMLFSAPTVLKPAGRRCSPFLMRGRRPALRDWSSIRPAARGHPARLNC
jgi:hypothetical protein